MFDYLAVLTELTIRFGFDLRVGWARRSVSKFLQIGLKGISVGKWVRNKSPTRWRKSAEGVDHEPGQGNAFDADGRGLSGKRDGQFEPWGGRGDECSEVRRCAARYRASKCESKCDCQATAEQRTCYENE